MFATLLGTLPRPAAPGLGPEASPEALLDAILETQIDHGLGPLTDAGWSITPDDPLASWRLATERSGTLVKAVLTGPYTTGRPVDDVRADLRDLAAAGCAWIEVHEPAAVAIGDDVEARARFVDDHVSLTADLDGVHLSLAIVGGAADAAGIDTIMAGAYASLGVDLIEGPDNWRLVTAMPTDRGVICGAVSAKPGFDDSPEILLWAAAYAASTGRGRDRVGLATAGSLAGLSWDAATAKLAALAAGARLAEATPEEQLAAMDPRAVHRRSRNIVLG